MEDWESLSEGLCEWLKRNTSHDMIFSWSKEGLIKRNRESFTAIVFISESKSFTCLVCNISDLRLDIIEVSL